jgi:hypothetical protein
VHRKNIALAALLALASSLAGAQTVYRCGSSYSQQPCTGATEVPVADPRTSAEAQRAARAGAADAKLAGQMEKSRLAQEKNAPKAIVIAPQVPVKEEAKKDGGKGKPAKLDQFTAVSPRAPAEAKKKPRKKKQA